MFLEKNSPMPATKPHAAVCLISISGTRERTGTVKVRKLTDWDQDSFVSKAKAV